MGWSASNGVENFGGRGRGGGGEDLSEEGPKLLLLLLIFLKIYLLIKKKFGPGGFGPLPVSVSGLDSQLKL